MLITHPRTISRLVSYDKYTEGSRLNVRVCSIAYKVGVTDCQVYCQPNGSCLAIT